MSWDLIWGPGWPWTHRYPPISECWDWRPAPQAQAHLSIPDTSCVFGVRLRKFLIYLYIFKCFLIAVSKLQAWHSGLWFILNSVLWELGLDPHSSSFPLIGCLFCFYHLCQTVGGYICVFSAGSSVLLWWSAYLFCPASCCFSLFFYYNSVV